MEKQLVSIHGKEYELVASRVHRFRVEHPDWNIRTEIVRFEKGECLMKAMIIDEKNSIRATGHAHELQGSSNINKTSFVECCESSAIGRALACFDYQGGEFASAEEVANAIKQQSTILNPSQTKQNTAQPPKNTFKQPLSTDDNAKIQEINTMVGEMFGNEPNAMADYIETVSSFQGKNGVVKGKRDLKELSPAWLNSTYKKIKEEYDTSFNMDTNIGEIQDELDQ